jgi:phenylalanyl-tRNA synthetase beta chain
VLERLECKIEGDNIIVPSFRHDLTCMQDVAEEIIRIYGYNNIKSTCIYAETTQGGRTPKQQYEVDSEYMLYGMGFDQIQTFSFISPKYYDKVRMAANSPLRRSVVISNPLGEDTSVMRTTALPSMMEVIARNNNMGNENVWLYEMASTYIPNGEGELPTEGKSLVLSAYGDVDFYKMKGVVDEIAEVSGVKLSYASYSEDNAYHPGRCAKIFVGDKEIGVIGQIHPLTADNYGMDIPVYAAVIDFDVLFAVANRTKHYKALPKYPASTRDFSFVCDEALEVGKIMAVMQKAGGKQCEGVALFDIYRGPQVGEGKKSVTMRMTLRADDHTLTVEDADKVSKKVLTLLDRELGLTLRG